MPRALKAVAVWASPDLSRPLGGVQGAEATEGTAAVDETGAASRQAVGQQ